ncbi:hypothetical protein ACHMZP_32320 [Rhodococcus baikonurensis]|uniref:hypothetical protein n=1 Tax=Rhodococcus erythropolis group TaxID=2840174 RepID=UPI00117B423E|nr:hypothetical protein [Rhodococcus erythropolis]PBI86859.1 hypothetical protein BKP42_63090 [Rhodococcus erythropolis]
MTGWNAWSAGSKVTVREFITEVNTLLGAVLQRLPEPRASEALTDALAAALRTDGREAVLPISGYEAAQDHRGAVAAQARILGEGITQLSVTLQNPEPSAMSLRSRCEGHVWTHAAERHLTASPDAPILMQLYNEWLHQLILLRDVLLPYENWEEVELAVDEQGLRRVTSVREAFVSELLTRGIRHQSIVRLAAAGVTNDPIEGAYGFGTRTALVLPVVLYESPWTASPTLLRWTRGCTRGDRATTAFVAEDLDYLATPRSSVADHTGISAIGKAVITESGRDNRGVRLSISISGLTELPPVDVGQALRGHRYAYRELESNHEDLGNSTAITRHSARNILQTEGLVEFPPGIHIVDDIPDPRVGFMLCGKILPHNTILRNTEPWSDTSSAGKTGPPKVILNAPKGAGG